jgi:hypothetical protein
MEKAAEYAGRLRRRFGPWLPGSWRSARTTLRTVEGRRTRSPAVMELDPERPSSSWVAWEVSRIRPGPSRANDRFRGARE